MTFICYPKCSTCKKARAFLQSKGVEFTERDIAVEKPSETELRAWQEKSALPLRRFFNTSGMLYRSMNLSQRLGEMSDDEQFALLATDGMLVKRPLLILDDGKVLVGFKEAEWEAAI